MKDHRYSKYGSTPVRDFGKQPDPGDAEPINLGDILVVGTAICVLVAVLFGWIQ